MHGAVSVRGLRPVVRLCRCPCHDGCPAATRDSIPLTEWAESCTCPGSGAAREQARSWLHDHGASLSDLKGVAERNVAMRDEAMAAAKERGSGRSSEEVRQILTEEYTARGLKVPHEAAMEILIDSIVNPGLLNAAGRTVRMLADVGRQANEIIKLFGNVKRIKGPEGSSAYFVPPDHTRPMTEVILDPEAESVLQAVSRGRSEPDDVLLVWLEPMNSESDDSAVVSVTAEGGRIGKLSAEDSKAYEYALRNAKASGRTLTVMARCHEGSDGRLSVRISPAGTAWWSQ
jgi:hypothetical protein